MYTLLMSWSVRASVLTVLLAWGLAPQLACFMPEQTLTPSEMDCCQQMANDCGGSTMSHTCCGTVARADVGIVTKAVRNATPQFETAGIMTDSAGLSVLRFDGELCNQSDHAPPDPSSSFVILRI